MDRIVSIPPTLHRIGRGAKNEDVLAILWNLIFEQLNGHRKINFLPVKGQKLLPLSGFRLPEGTLLVKSLGLFLIKST
jgi:hypothetical protein